MTQREPCNARNVMSKVMPAAFLFFASFVTHYTSCNSFAQEEIPDTEKRYRMMEEEISRVSARREAIMEEAMAKLSYPKEEKKFFF